MNYALIEKILITLVGIILTGITAAAICYPIASHLHFSNMECIAFTFGVGAMLSRQR